MRTRWFCVLAAVLLLALIAACGDDEKSAKEDLVGKWMATKMEYTDVATPARKVDIIAEGHSFTLTLASNNRYRAIITPPSGQGGPMTETGNWSNSVDLLSVTPEGMPWSVEFEFDLSGDRLTLSGGDSEFDFDGTGHPRSAKLNLILTRM